MTAPPCGVAMTTAVAQVLTWGLLSAAVLRLGMILIGVELIDNFQPVLLGFAGVLLFSSWGLLTRNEDADNEDLSDNGIVKLCRWVSWHHLLRLTSNG